MPGAALGAVFVGGQSRRMGTDKALIEAGGERLVDRTARILREAGCEQVAAIGPRQLAGDYVGSVGLVADDHPGAGPLGALLTALRLAAQAGAAGVMVAACDLPALDVATVAAVLAAASPGNGHVGIAVADSGRREPLLSWWHTRTLATVEAAFDAGERSVLRVIEHVAMGPAMGPAVGAVVDVPVGADAVFNMNTPDQRPE